MRVVVNHPSEYFALTVEGIATIVPKNGKKIFEYSNGVME